MKCKMFKKCEIVLNKTNLGKNEENNIHNYLYENIPKHVEQTSHATFNLETTEVREWLNLDPLSTKENEKMCGILRFEGSLFKVYQFSMIF